MSDLRFGLRSLRRNPAFAVTAILTLAFGIGAVTSILSVVSGVMVRPLPYPNAARILLLNGTGQPGTPYSGRRGPFSAANFVDLRREAHSLAQVAAFRSWSYTLSERGEADLVPGAKVSPGLFEALGVAPALGRSFDATDERNGSEPIAILGDGLWRRRFGADPSVIGRPVTLNGQRFTIVGVMPTGFEFPRGAELPSGLQFGSRTELWVPLAFTEGELGFRGLENLAVLALPKTGETPRSVAADLGVVAGRLRDQFPDANRNWAVALEPMLESAIATVRPSLVLLLGAVGFLLLIACVNVSNLLLTRTAGRAREVAVRSALGAPRGRLVAQFMTENLVLVAIGGGLGVALAVLGKDALLALAPDNLPRRADIAIDWTVLASAVGIMLAIGAGFGLLVAGEATGAGRAERLREGSKGSDGRTGRRLRSALVIVEVAVSVMLLSGAGILGRTFQNLRRVDAGFKADGLLTAQVSLPRTTSDFREFGRLVPEWARFYQRYTDELEQRPQVEAVAVATQLPLTGAWESSGFQVLGRPAPDPDRVPTALFVGVSDGYFRTMGIPVLRGRTFERTDRDSASAKVVLSETAAKTYWPGADPIGQQIQGFFRQPLLVIGIVADVHHRDLSGAPTPQMYFPMQLYASPTMMLVARTRGAPLSLAGMARETLRAQDPTIPMTKVQTMDQVLAESVAQQRMSAILVGIFAVAALGLAVLGLYGVISFGVARRSREIGIRLALGASPGRVLGQVVGEGAMLSGTGVVIGVMGAAALGRLLTSLVYNVSPTDPATLASVSLVLVAIALAACLIPARRAMGVEPVVVLRQE